MEDLSNLINTYEVPNLLGSGDLAGIFENIRPRAKQANMDGNKDSLYNFFMQEVRGNVASDVGEVGAWRDNTPAGATLGRGAQSLQLSPRL